MIDVIYIYFINGLLTYVTRQTNKNFLDWQENRITLCKDNNIYIWMYVWKGNKFTEIFYNSFSHINGTNWTCNYCVPQCPAGLGKNIIPHNKFNFIYTGYQTCEVIEKQQKQREKLHWQKTDFEITHPPRETFIIVYIICSTAGKNLVGNKKSCGEKLGF